MKLKEYIASLQTQLDIHGDIPVIFYNPDYGYNKAERPVVKMMYRNDKTEDLFDYALNDYHPCGLVVLISQ